MINNISYKFVFIAFNDKIILCLFVILLSPTLQIMYLYYLLGWKGYISKNPPKIIVGYLF